MTKENIPEGMDISGAEHWREKLAASGHYITLKSAGDVFAWYSLRDGPLILQGEPGCGKTSLILKIAEITGARLYRVQCYAGVKASALLYRWNEVAQQMAAEHAQAAGREVDWWDAGHLILCKLGQALLEPSRDVIVLLDEMDKVEEGGECETALLEFTGEHTITINETSRILRRPPGLPPLAVAITSNAGANRFRESLSEPTLRRTRVIEFEPLSREKIYEVLSSAVPEIPESLRTEISWFVEGLRRTCNWQKPISLSETIMWARALQLFRVSRLTEEIVLWTDSSLAKGTQEKEDLRLAAPRLIRFVRNRVTKAA